MFGWLVILSGIVTVLNSWETVAAIGSLETTEELRRRLDEPPFSSAGMGLEAMRETHRVAAIIGAAAAGGAAVFAIWAMRRDRTARLVLSLLAVPVLLTGYVLGGLAPTLLAVAAMMLWLQPSRDWYDGKDYVPPEPPEEPSTPSAQDPWSRPDRDTGPDARWAAPDPGQRRPEGPAPTRGAPAARGQQRPSLAQRTRPGALVRACLLAGVFSAGAFGLVAAALTMLLGDTDGMVEAMQRQEPALGEAGITGDQLVLTLTVMLGVVALWCAAGVVAAYATLRGAEWGRITLIVLAVVTGVASVALGVVNPMLLVVALACVITVVLLVRPEVAAWTRGNNRADRRTRDPMVP